MMEQPSLFGEALPETPLPDSAPDFDALPKLFEMIDGVWRIADDRLEAWASYSQIEIWIARHKDDLCDLGKLLQTVKVTGHRGPPRVMTYLDKKQARYFLNHCRLPHLRPYRKRVMLVLDEYEAGNLVSTNAATTILLQDATEAAESSAPGSTQLGKLTERMKQVEKTATEALTVGNQALKIALGPRMTYPQTPEEAERFGRRAKRPASGSRPATYVDPETGEVRVIPPLAEPRKA
jgi:hypothetical protein